MVNSSLVQTNTVPCQHRFGWSWFLGQALLSKVASVALIIGIFAVPIGTACAQTSRVATDKLLQAEQSILSSLSARAVSFTDLQPAQRPPAPHARAVSSRAESGASEAVQQEPAAEQIPKQKNIQVEERGVENPPLAKAAPLESLSQLRTTNALLRSQLEQRELQVSALTKQVQELQSQLTIAEVEVERLSAVMDAKTRATLGQYKLTPPNTAVAARAVARDSDARSAAAPADSVAPPRDVPPPSSDNNLEVATVAVPKAELRLGPGNNHSALLSLPRGSRLAVEMRQGAWLRVFAPSGERAWIHASLVRFGDSAAKPDQSSAVSVKGASGAAEDEAFKRFQRGTGTR
jgi:hypothetical protein